MNHEAERRRSALIRFMKSRNLNRGRLARQAQISPNIVYNFLKGESSYLSQPTLERIAQTYAVPIGLLTGEDALPAGKAVAFAEAGAAMNGPQISAPIAAAPALVKVAGSVIEGRVWAETIFVEAAAEDFVSLTLPSLYTPHAFAVRLDSAAMAAILPKGAVLGCVPAAAYLQRLAHGDIVIVVRRNEKGLFQTSVRQYGIDGETHYVALCPVKATPAKTDRLDLAAPLETPMALGYQDFFIHAVVLAYAADLPALRR